MLKNLKWLLIPLLMISQYNFAQPSETPPPDFQNKFTTCLEYLGKDEYGRAISGLQELINDYPEYPLPYRHLVEAYIFIDDLEAAASYFRHLQDKNSQNPYVYYALARLDYLRRDYDQAIEKLKNCISLDATYLEAYGPYGGLPDVYRAKKDLDAGERFFKERINANPRDSYAYLGMARIYAKNRQWIKTLKAAKKASELDSSISYIYHTNLLAYEITGKYKNALENAERLLHLAIEENDEDLASYALLKIGGLYFIAGNFGQSLAYLNRSYKIASRIGAKKREGMALTNLGAVYATLGNYQKALEYFKMSLNILDKTGTYRTRTRNLYNIGLIYKDTGNYEEAFEFFEQALRLAELRGYQIDKSMIITGIAENYLALQQIDQAMQNYEKALQIAIEVGDESYQAYIERNLGGISHIRKNFREAVRHYQKVLELGTRIHDARIIWEAHSGLGASYQKLDDTPNAIHHYGNAIAIFDSIRQNLDIESLASGFLEDKYQVYPSIIQLLAQEKRYDEALKFAEKYKAKTLLKILSKGHFLLTELLPDSVRFDLLELRYQLEDAHAALSNELAKPERDEETILELDQKITGLEIEKASKIKSVRQNFPTYYQLTSSDPVTANQLKGSILKPNQCLIEFIVGPEKTSVFAIGKDTLAYREISVSQDSLSQMMSNLSRIFHFQSANETVHTGNIFNADLADFSIPPLFSLFQTLFSPIDPLLTNVDELIIVPDDILFYLPFEALVTDTSGMSGRYDFENPKFLVEQFNISYASSASLLDPELQPDRHPSGNLLAFGNPVFAAHDQDLISANHSDTSGASLRVNRFLPLPNSESEVKTIGNLLNASAGNIYTGKEARESVFKQRAENFRILHLASHFIVNDRDPLYSRVVLAQTGNEEEDGFLQTYEVFGMKLNADLVVLSACNSALGKLSKGEGLVGITRGFLYAGVPSMVVSLWSVDDEATGIIMGNFYRYLRNGMPKNKALRQAKLEYLNNSDLSHKDPFYWAPFVLIGDSQPVHLETGVRSYTLWVSILTIMLGAGLAAFFFIRKKISRQ